MTLAEVLALHQWEFDNRYFCTCGAAIKYDLPLLGYPREGQDDRAMAAHQIEAITAAGFTLSKEASTTEMSGYAYTHEGAQDRIPEAELKRAVAENSRVPLRAGIDGPIVGYADLSVDDRGLKADLQIDNPFSGA
jgi:hypothetical protein